MAIGEIHFDDHLATDYQDNRPGWAPVFEATPVSCVLLPGVRRTPGVGLSAQIVAPAARSRSVVSLRASLESWLLESTCESRTDVVLPWSCGRPRQIAT